MNDIKRAIAYFKRLVDFYSGQEAHQDDHRHCVTALVALNEKLKRGAEPKEDN